MTNTTSTTEQPSKQPSNPWGIESWQDVIFSPIGLLIVLFAAFHLSKRKHKNEKLHRGELATEDLMKNARERACKAMAEKKHNDVAFYIGTPRGAEFSYDGKTRTASIPQDPQTLYLCNGESGMAEIGINGSGKTFSMNLPTTISAIHQGMPIIYLDVKYTSDNPNPTSLIAGIAKDHGYQVSLFAPGCKESQSCDFLRFLNSPLDSENAAQLAKAYIKNCKVDNAGPEHPFFAKAGVSTFQGLLMLAKLSMYPDLIMVREMASNPKLFELIAEADLGPINQMPFDTALSSIDAPEQLAGIRATIAALLSDVLMPGLLPALMGNGNQIPIDYDGRQMLILGCDGNRADVVRPLIATVLHMIVQRNVTKQRKRPLVLKLDELPWLFLPELDDWLNQRRSAGLCVDAGWQSKAMLGKRYGKGEALDRIYNGFVTQAYFQLGSYQEAQAVCNKIGKEDIEIYTSGSSKSRGSKSKSETQAIRDRWVVDPSEFTQFGRGKCVLFNRGFATGDRQSVPYLVNIKIPQHDLDLVKASTEQWPDIKQDFLDRAATFPDLETAFKRRKEEVNHLLKPAPTPKELLFNAIAEVKKQERNNAELSINGSKASF